MGSDSLELCALGFVAGVLAACLLLLVFTIFASPDRVRPRIRAREFSVRTFESANWLNIALARVNSAQLDRLAMQTLCNLLSEAFASDPTRPGFLAEMTLKPLKFPTRMPIFSQFIVSPSDAGARLDVQMNYQGQPSVAVSIIAWVGPAAVPKLLSFAFNVEFILDLFVAEICLVHSDDAGELAVAIGNDFVVDVKLRPLYDVAQGSHQKFVMSISAWLSRLLSNHLRGKRFPIPNQFDEAQ